MAYIAKTEQCMTHLLIKGRRIGKLSASTPQMPTPTPEGHVSSLDRWTYSVCQIPLNTSFQTSMKGQFTRLLTFHLDTQTVSHFISLSAAHAQSGLEDPSVVARARLRLVGVDTGRHKRSRNNKNWPTQTPTVCFPFLRVVFDIKIQCTFGTRQHFQFEFAPTSNAGRRSSPNVCKGVFYICISLLG